MGPLALSWFGVVVWRIVEDMVGKEKPNLYVDQIIWRELVASIMLSVCIAAWMIDMSVQEIAAEQACSNNVVNGWRSRLPKHWASKMLRRLGWILIAAQVRILQEHIATGDNLLSDGSNWKHLREGGSLKEVHRDFVFNELPRKGRARVYKGVYPPQFQCTRLVLEGSLRFVGQAICQRNNKNYCKSWKKWLRCCDAFGRSGKIARMSRWRYSWCG